MNNLNDITSFTASQARSDFYTLVRSASTGLSAYEITLRGSDPVIMLSKAEYQSWMETIDILNSPSEMQNIRLSKKSKKILTHEQILAKLKI